MARSFRRNCRGQVIVVTALLVAVILLSTAMYVIEIEKETPTVQSNDGVPMDSYQNSVRSTLVSALANVSGGGNTNVFASDLATLRTVITSHSYESQLTMDYTLLNSDGYTNGIHLSWGSSGYGISSAYTTVSCSASNSLGTSQVNYSVNITSSIHVSGDYTQLNETHKEINLTIHVFDESGAALADHFTISYRNGTSWSNIDSPTIVSLGDGSYNVTFYALTGQSGEPLDISAVCVTARGISVSATLTCSTRAVVNVTLTDTNLAPIFQNGITQQDCNWADYDGTYLYYGDHVSAHQIMARDDVNTHLSHSSIVLNQQNMYNPYREINGEYISVQPGDVVRFKVWVKTAAGTGNAAIIGFDVYGDVNRILEIHTCTPQTAIWNIVNDIPTQGGSKIYIPYGISDWTLLTLDVTIPDLIYTHDDFGNPITSQQIKGLIPWMGGVWNGRADFPDIWFADAELYINPTSESSPLFGYDQSYKTEDTQPTGYISASLLATSSEVTVGIPYSWVNFPLSYAVKENSVYPFRRMSDATLNTKYNAGNTGQGNWKSSVTYPTSPNPFSSGGSNTYKVVICRIKYLAYHGLFSTFNNDEIVMGTFYLKQSIAATLKIAPIKLDEKEGKNSE
jgi:hypothetical protein